MSARFEGFKTAHAQKGFGECGKLTHAKTLAKMQKRLQKCKNTCKKND